MKAADSLLPYAPEEQVTGTIRLWGHGSPKHDFMGRLVLRWDQEFHRYQPHVAIVNDMYGTASAAGALYTGAGDLAILGEEVSPAAERAFRRERHYPPTIFEVRTGHFTQPLAPTFLQDSLSQSGQTACPCASAR